MVADSRAARRRLRAASGVLLLAGLAACADSDEGPAPVEDRADVDPAPPAEPRPAPAPAPAPALSPDGQPTAPPRPSEPAPATAGDLGQDDLPRSVLGFVAGERPPAEGEYVPNGTWTHAVDAERAAREALPSCGPPPGGWAAPAHALAATYLDDDRRPGNGLLLGFESSQQATQYAEIYRRRLEACGSSDPATAATAVETAPDWYTGRRSYGPEGWSEVVARRGTEVLLLIVNDNGAAEADALRRLAEQVAG